MQNLDELEKSRGVVVFAFRSETVDYVKIADQTSRLIRKNLNLPITLITDPNTAVNFNYDKIIEIKNTGSNFRTTQDNQLVEWRNFGRYLAYQLSPYDETLLLDTDYAVLDSSLNKVWDCDFDYKIVQESTLPEAIFQRRMGYLSHNWLWATVVFFRKTKKAKALFDLIGRVQRNYKYYKTLFNLNGNYRNDFAFAIADIVVNGYTVDLTNYLPDTMLSIQKTIQSIEVKESKLISRHDNTAVVTPWQNIHIMDKNFLTTKQFERFVDSATA